VSPRSRRSAAEYSAVLDRPGPGLQFVSQRLATGLRELHDDPDIPGLRIPPSADMLARNGIQLDADGNLLAYRRTRRYMRGQALDAEQTDPHNATEQT
jgi:hypothetical protein